MIFKKLFKPFGKKPLAKLMGGQQKWQDENPQIRIEALSDLSADEPKHKAILHELAFNDASDKVRRQALERLNDFSLWWQASKSEKNDKLKKFAEQNIRAGLLGNANFTVDETLKNQFIEQCNKGSLLEELALKDKSDDNRLMLLEKLNKSQLFMQSLQDPATSITLKTALIDKVNDLGLLEKLNKKTDPAIKALLSSKIDGIKSALQKPLQLKKDVGLMLAKFNALKDRNDIEEIERRQAQLMLEWETLQQSFALLADEEVTEFKHKFGKIETSVNNLTAPLKAKWQEQQAVAADLAEKEHNKKQIAERLAAVEALLTAAIADHDESADSYSEPLKQIQQEMQQLNLAQNVKTVFIQQMEQFHQKISQIPLISECISEAKRLLELLTAMPVPSDLGEFNQVAADFKQWQKQWRDNQTRIGLAFPESITSAYKALNSSWQTAIAPLSKEQEQLFSQAKKGLADLKHLLAGGKYRRAFGLFKKVNLLNGELNEGQQSRIARDFDAVKAKVEELADWQEYIATPRKQQILAEMVELAENPLESPQEQAKKVRFTRQMWNSLGKIKATDEDGEGLEQQFDQACEKAFEICRVFYAEKEAIRAQNLTAKQAICERLEAAAATLKQASAQGSEQAAKQEAVSWQQLESSLAQIRKDWRNSGDIDREHVADLNKRYFDLLNPLQSAVRANQAENATLKEALIEKATALLEADDFFTAANQLKDLQQSWKEIGFCGGKADSALWRKFRQVNDQVFAKRDEVKNQRNEENQQLLNTLNHQLNEIEEQIKAAENIAALRLSETALQGLNTNLGDAPKHVQGKISGKAQALQNQLDTRKKDLKENAARQLYVTLFNQFEHYSSAGELNPEIASTPAWNNVISSINGDGDSSLRYDLTIGLEIALGVESPVRDTDRRMELQMEMLSNKMNDGQQAAQQDELLKDWLRVGKLAEDDAELLERVRSLFLS